MTSFAPTPAAPEDPDLEAVIGLLCRDGDDLLAAGTLADLTAGADRLVQARCNVVVLGAFKRGKSTLLNALLERAVLPTGVLPLTSAPTVIRYGADDRLLVRFADGRAEAHPLSVLSEFATEPQNPGNRRGVAMVEVELSHSLLASGLQLVDTPGIASVHLHNTQAAYDLLGRVDAALCVMSADQPLAEQEVELYRAAAARAGSMLYVLTKVDQLSADDCEQALRFVSRALREQGIADADADADVLAVSALAGRGVRELRTRLQDLAAAAREDVVATAVARTARAAAIELARRCELEERALKLPLEELDERARVLEQRLAELEAAHTDANDLMHRRVARLTQERVNVPLLDYARTHEERLQRALDVRAGELSDRSPRALAGELDEWIDATVRTTFAALAAEMQATVAAELIEVAAGHADRIERLVDEVHRAAAESLGFGGPEQLPRVALAAPAGFTFKLHDPEHGLEMVVGSARRAAPRALGRRLVRGDAAQRLRGMTDRHAGRLRAELVARTSEAAAAYRRELDVAMRETCDAVRGAIAHARHERTRGDDAARARLEDLADRRARAVAAERRLDAVSTQRR